MHFSLMSDMFFVISNTEQRKTRNDKERKRKVKHKHDMVEIHFIGRHNVFSDYFLQISPQTFS